MNSQQSCHRPETIVTVARTNFLDQPIQLALGGSGCQTSLFLSLAEATSIAQLLTAALTQIESASSVDDRL